MNIPFSVMLIEPIFFNLSQKLYFAFSSESAPFVRINIFKIFIAI